MTNIPTPFSPLTHASVMQLKRWTLDSGNLNAVPSNTIVKCLFGIPGDSPSPLDITGGIIKAGGSELITILNNKYNLGDLWTFTTDFGISATLKKLPHDDGINSLMVVLNTSNSDGTITQRPLIDYTARGTNYFEPSEVLEVPVDEPVQPTNEETKNDEPIPENGTESLQEPVVDGGTDAQETTTTDSQEGSDAIGEIPDPSGSDGNTVEAEQDGDVRTELTNVDDLQETEQPVDESSKKIPLGDMTVSVVDEEQLISVRESNRLWQKTHKLLSKGKVKNLIDLEDQLSELVPGYLVTVSIGSNKDHTPVMEIRVSTSEPEPKNPSDVAQPVKHEAFAEEQLEEQHARDVAGEVAAAEVAAEELHEAGEHEQAAAIEQRTQEIVNNEPKEEPSPVNEPTTEVKEDEVKEETPVAPKLERVIVSGNGAEVPDEIGTKVINSVQYIVNKAGYRDLNIISGTISQIIQFHVNAEWNDTGDTCTITIGDPLETAIEEPEEEPMIGEAGKIVLNFRSLRDIDLASLNDGLREWISTRTLSDMKDEILSVDLPDYLGSMIPPADPKIKYAYTFDSKTLTLTVFEPEEQKVEINPEIKVVTDFVSITGDALKAVQNGLTELVTEYAVDFINYADKRAGMIYDIIHDAIQAGCAEDVPDFEQNLDLDALTLTVKEIVKEEPVIPEEERVDLEQAMNSEKDTTPVKSDYIDLDDENVRIQALQVLFPDVIDPAMTHLMRFLKAHHYEEQTPSFLATKETIPTETTIVYDNITYAIVKMKDGRFWRIFAANTDYGLEDHSWISTRNTPGRWHQLGRDIHDNQNFERGYRGRNNRY